MSFLLQFCNEPAAIPRTSLTAYYDNRKKEDSGCNKSILILLGRSM